MSARDRFVEAARAGRPVEGEVLIDAHGHLGQGVDFPILKSGAEGLIASMDRLGIRMTAVSANQAIFGDAEHGNAIVAEAIRAHPGRLFGYVVVDVGYPEVAVRQLEGALTAGFRGLKVWSYGSRNGLPYDHPNYDAVFAWADARDLPVLAHVFGPELDELAGRIAQFPRIRWLLAHVGSARLEAYLQYARGFPSVCVELCLSSCPRGLVEHLVAAGLEDKVVWGSDAVFLDQPSQMGRVLFAQIPVEAKRKILGLNARHVLRLEASP